MPLHALCNNLKGSKVKYVCMFVLALPRFHWLKNSRDSYPIPLAQ